MMKWSEVKWGGMKWSEMSWNYEYNERRFVFLGGETLEQPSTIPLGRGPHPTPISQPDFDMSPSQPNFKISPSQQDFGVSPRKTTPKIDMNQQEMYNYIESLEKMARDPGTSSA